MSKPEVSVVIPCLNEGKTLVGCIEAAFRGIKAAGIEGEVVISDNGSTDRSVELAEAAGARVVHCEHRGYGNALRAGFAAAEGEWIIMGDADQSYDFGELPRFRDKLKEDYDLVMGSRLTGDIEDGAMPFLHKYLGNPVLSAILRIMFHVRVSDAHCGLRCFTKDAIQRMDLRTGGMELASEIAMKAGMAGLNIGEIPITLHKDARDRRPHLRTFRDGWRHLRYMLMMAPNWLFFVPGGLLGGVGAVLLFALLPGPMHLGRVVLDVHTMLLAMALVVLGTYILLVGCFVKAFTYTEGLAQRSSVGFSRLLRRVKLEHGLVLGGLLLLIGLAGDAAFLVNWMRQGMGPLDVSLHMRLAIVFTTVLVVGVQICFASFFLSMLGISRGDYVGEYTRRDN
ncbi:MAG: glycosyltransferase family 2 protein [Kiritimatiellia bacterium]|jgi:glycosyltransferase involved in cell wall biosynthesis|nr:glycosyltransferase family 2 protein [Kiritimatiellia bacterium]